MQRHLSVFIYRVFEFFDGLVMRLTPAMGEFVKTL